MAVRFWLAILGIVAVGGGAGYFAAPLLDGYMSATDEQALAVAEPAPQSAPSAVAATPSAEDSAIVVPPEEEATAPAAEQSPERAEAAETPARTEPVGNLEAAAAGGSLSPAPSVGAISRDLGSPSLGAAESGVAPPPAPSASDAQTAALAAARTALRDSGVASLQGDAPAADTTTGVRPIFDVVRVEPSGAAVVAGRAAPGAMVSVKVDGEVQTEVEADRRGEFVALLDPPADERPGLTIELSSVARDGAVATSETPVVIVLPKTPGRTALAVRPSRRGAELLQPTAPRIDGGLSIDAVTYDDDGDVVITGRGTPGEVARIYLDDGLRMETRVDPDGGWRAALDGEVPPQVYNLRVDQIDVGGVVSSRAETPFERAPVEDIVLREGGVIVQPGNNLWRIASHVYGDGFQYLVIFEENRAQIRDPDLIYPGQVFDLPSTLDATTIQ